MKPYLGEIYSQRMKPTKFTKQQIFDLYNGLNAVGHLGGAKFAYAVARNISKLQPEIDALNKAYAASEDFVAYDKERAQLAESHATKVDGKPQKTVENGIAKYVIEDQEKFDKDLKVLQEKHKEAIDKRQKQLDDFQEILKEETEIELYAIPPEYIPENIKAQEMAGILLIIDESLSVNGRTPNLPETLQSN